MCCAKRAESIEMPFAGLTNVDWMNHLLHVYGGWDPAGEGAILRVVCPIEKYWESAAAHALHPRCAFPFAADRPHRPCSEIFLILFALAWHTEWSCLLYGVIGNWMIPVAANATAMAAAKIAYAFECPGQPQNIAPSLLGSASRLIHGSVVPPEPSSKTACRSV